MNTELFESPDPLCDDCDGRGYHEDSEGPWRCETCESACEIVCGKDVEPCESKERVDLYQRITSASHPTRIARDITLCSHDCARSRFLDLKYEDAFKYKYNTLESFVSDFQTLSLTLRELPADHPSRAILLEIQETLKKRFEDEIWALERRAARAHVGDQ